MRPRTLFDKVWDEHVVVPETPEAPAVLYVDLHLVHEVTSPQAFDTLRARGLRVRRPERTLATIDHSTPTLAPDANGERPFVSAAAARQVERLVANCEEFDVPLHAWDSAARGIVHVMGPELGATWPGRTIVCGDSHTSTHGAFGALAFGIGTTQVAHVLATQAVLQRRPRTMAVELEGTPPEGTSAKDLALAAVAELGAGGGAGHVLEFRGEAVRALSMEGRMTLCNMSIEAGARAGMVAPDETTARYVEGRPLAPRGNAWEAAADRWRGLSTDPGARFDVTVTVPVGELAPMITFGTSPDMAVPVDGATPDSAGDPRYAAALDYMGLEPGQPLAGHPVDVVFVGSCTNARLSDLRDAAAVLRGRRVANGVRALVVPGSGEVRRAAEAEGLDRVFADAGAEWREPGCSMCIAMNGDRVAPGQYAVSTSNRNFPGRQGPGARTFLASPATAAAAAVTGRITDPRELVAEPVAQSVAPSVTGEEARP